MGQIEYENFRLAIKEWMDNHPEEYEQFEEDMNNRDNSGYQNILMLAFKIIPEYKKVIKKRFNQGTDSGISDIETLFAEKKVPESLINEFQNTPEGSIVPAMLSWLYFGKSFERMVERGEEIRRSPDIGYIEKFMIAFTIKLIISKSISLGLRTKSDWEDHKRLMQTVQDGDVVEWAMEDILDEKKKIGRKSNKQLLPEMLLMEYPQELENLISRIGNLLISKRTKRDIACLKIALEELHYIKPCEVKTFRDALDDQYGKDIHIISERGVQDAYKSLNEFSSKGKQVKEIKENRIYIEEIKKLISD